MFLGEYQTKFTGVGRVVLPRKMREQLQGSTRLILSRGIDQCIWGFDLMSWQQQAERQLEVPLTTDEGRDLRRYIFSGAEEVELDAQGRFIIPPSLLKYARLEQEVVIIGAGDHLEIWNTWSWQETLNRLEERNR